MPTKLRKDDGSFVDADDLATGEALEDVVGDASAGGDTLGELEDAIPVKATGAEVNTGSNDAKFVTPKAIEDSDYVKAFPAVLEANFDKTNDTFANVTDLMLTLGAGKWYRITGQFTWIAGAGGAKIDFNGGAATITGMRGSYIGNAAGLIGESLVALTTAIESVENGFVHFDFTVQINAGGTLIPRFAQTTTDAEASSLLKYSSIQAVEVTPPA